MLLLGEKPLLEHIVSDFIGYGFKNFIFTVYYLHDKISDYFRDGGQWGINIQYFKESEPLGTAGCLHYLSNESHDPYIIVNGDILTKVNYQNLLNYHQVQEADITICIRPYEIEIPYGVIKFEGHLLSHIQEKPSYCHFVNAGIYVINPLLISQSTLVPPYDMTDFISHAINLKKKIVVFPIHEYWIDVGRMEDYQAVKGSLEPGYSSTVLDVGSDG